MAKFPNSIFITLLTLKQEIGYYLSICVLNLFAEVRVPLNLLPINLVKDVFLNFFHVTSLGHVISHWSRDQRVM